MIKQKDGRRNRHQIEAHLPLPEPGTREPAISEVLAPALLRPLGQPDLSSGLGPRDGRCERITNGAGSAAA